MFQIFHLILTRENKYLQRHLLSMWVLTLLLSIFSNRNSSRICVVFSALSLSWSWRDIYQGTRCYNTLDLRWIGPFPQEIILIKRNFLSTSYRKEIAPWRRKFFQKKSPFRRGFVVQESILEVTKAVSSAKIVRKRCLQSPLKYFTWIIHTGTGTAQIL